VLVEGKEGDRRGGNGSKAREPRVKLVQIVPGESASNLRRVKQRNRVSGNARGNCQRTLVGAICASNLRNERQYTKAFHRVITRLWVASGIVRRE
jgi:hypothetical protein